MKLHAQQVFPLRRSYRSQSEQRTANSHVRLVEKYFILCQRGTNGDGGVNQHTLPEVSRSHR